MHRLNIPCLTVIAVFAFGCGGSKPPVTPEGEAKGDQKKDDSGDKKADGDKKEDSGDKKADADDKSEKGAKKDECTGFEIGNLEDLLLKNACEVPNAKPDALPSADLKGKVDVSVAASPATIMPGGKAELIVAFVNKSKDPQTLHFRIDPTARFEVEVYDKKNARAEMPPGKPPPAPKGVTQPPPSDPKVAHVNLPANGSARVRIPWEAVKRKWAPEKLRGTPPEKGFPTVPDGPLPKGHYVVKVITPLVGVADRDMTEAKLDLDLGVPPPKPPAVAKPPAK